MHRLWLKQHLVDHGVLYLPHHLVTMDQIERYIQNHSYEIHQQITFEEWKHMAHEYLQWKENEIHVLWTLMCSFTESPLGLLPYAELLIWLFLHSDKPSRLSLDGLSEFNMEEHWSTPERIVPPVPTIGHEKNTIMEMKFINHVQNHMGDLLTLLFPGNSHVNISELYCLDFLFNASSFENDKDNIERSILLLEHWTDLLPICEERMEASWSMTTITHFIKNQLEYHPLLYPLLGSLTTQLHVPERMVVEESSCERETIQYPPLVLSHCLKTTIIVPSVLVNNTSSSPSSDEEIVPVDVIIASCSDVWIYILAPVAFVTIVSCVNVTIVLGYSKGIVSIDRCEKIQFTGICPILRISNCLDSSFNVYTPTRPILTGDNRGLQIGPYNTGMPGLLNYLKMHAPAYLLDESGGKFMEFVNLAMEEEEDHDDEVVHVQPVEAYYIHTVPVPEKETLGTARIPMIVPESYATHLKSRKERVDTLRETIIEYRETHPELEMLIQSHFKDWLQSTGQLRHVHDLITLEVGRVPPS